MVYVDTLHKYPNTERWPFGEACHLLADTINELHNFAKRLGLKRSWFQMSSSGLPHYDLTKGMRFKALKLGAEDLSGDPKTLLALFDKWQGVQ